MAGTAAYVLNLPDSMRDVKMVCTVISARLWPDKICVKSGRSICPPQARVSFMLLSWNVI